MNLRIKEICKEQGIMLKDIADRINITEVGLSKSLNGNPTIGRLEEVAKALNVDFLELFEKRSTEEKPIYTKDESGKEIIIGYLKK
nr:MAG TPA: Helix-turn-helix XRE-family like protein [Caudoviricetes sp.]